MRVAVTGASGQVGSWVVELLNAGFQPAEVVAVCRNAFNAGLIGHARCKFRVGSILDPASARQTLSGCEAVAHCARAGGLPRESLRQNLAMIRAIAAVPEVRRFIYLSSVAAYGDCIDRRADRFDDPRPGKFYGREKLLCEREVARAFAGHGRQWFVLRLGHVYGPGQWLSKSVALWALSDEFRLPFAGANLSNAIRVDRVADAVAALLESRVPPGVYNLADDPHLSWRQLFDWHAQVLRLPEVRSLEPEESARLRAAVLSGKRSMLRRALRESTGWLRRLPAGYLAACPSLQELTYNLLAKLPAAWGERARNAQWRALAAASRPEGGHVNAAALPSYLFSDPMPGPYLKLLGSEREETMRRLLLNWYLAWSRPDGAWLTAPADPTADTAPAQVADSRPAGP